MSLLPEIDVSRVIIFLADAVRYDAVPEKVTQEGISYRAVAQSTATNTSVPSMLTGRYPENTGVYDWGHRLPQSIPSVFDLEVVNSSYDTSTTWWHGESPLVDIFDYSEEEAYSSHSKPKIDVIHDQGGHAPFEENDFHDFSTEEGLRSAYERNISKSTDRFTQLISELKRSGDFSDTLLVYVSDHGELLSERGGFCGHGYPVCPELVYTPICFIHPDLPNVSHGPKGVVELVDLLPTIVDALGVTVNRYDMDGESLFKVGVKNYGRVFRRHQRSFSFASKEISYRYEARGLFGPGGGHIFHNGPAPETTIHWLIDRAYGQRLHPRHRQLALRTLLKQWRCYLSSHVEYGDPKLDKSKAKAVVEEYVPREPTEEISIDSETQEALENLGYM